MRTSYKKRVNKEKKRVNKKQNREDLRKWKGDRTETGKRYKRKEGK